MRVYVPASRALLRSWVAAGVVPAAGAGAGPERSVAAEPDEESEYAALMAAAADSRAAGVPERVVVVGEIGGEDADAAFGLDRVVAVHADERADAHSDDDLSWFAPSEVRDLLA